MKHNITSSLAIHETMHVALANELAVLFCISTSWSQME